MLFLYLSQGPPKSYSPLKNVIRLLCVMIVDCPQPSIKPEDCYPIQDCGSRKCFKRLKNFHKDVTSVESKIKVKIKVNISRFPKAQPAQIVKAANPSKEEYFHKNWVLE